MDLVVAALCHLALAAPGSPAALTIALEEAAARGHLPTEFALEVASELELVVHRDESLSMAFYLPPESFAGLPIRPTLVLSGPVFVRQGRLLRVLEMPVDVAENFFHALLEAWIGLRSPPALRAGASVKSRRFERVPPEAREPAYLEAQADFGSHLLSVANELERKDSARRAEGRDLCAVARHPATLYAYWDGIFSRAEFRLRWSLPPSPPERTEASMGQSVRALDIDDKLFFVRVAFGGRWSGDRAADLDPRYCPELDRASARPEESWAPQAGPETSGRGLLQGLGGRVIPSPAATSLPSLRSASAAETTPAGR